MKKSDDDAKMRRDLRSRAEARLKKGMEGDFDAFRKDPAALVQELMVHQIELEMQNEELSRAQTEAHELYERFQDLYDFAPVCYLTLDRAGMIREANMTTASLLEVARSSLVNSLFGQFLVSPSWSSFQEFISQVLASEGGKTCELELTWGREATKKSALFEGIAVAATKDGEREVRIALLDITARRKAEELLRLSEARFRALYRDNPTMIFTLDAEGTILSANPACTRHLGYPLEELEGRSGLEVFHEQDRAAVADQLSKCLRNPEQVYHWEFRKVRKDGGLLWVEETARAVYDLKGALNVLVVCRDITERKRAEEALNQAKEEWESTFDSVPDLIAILDDQYRIVRVNRAMAERLGRRPEELRGRLCYEAIHGTDSRPEFCPHSMTMENGAGHEMETREGLLHGDFHVSSTPLLAQDGRMIGVVHVARDITERKQAEEEIARLNRDLAAHAAELEAANRDLEAFNYTVAHDLRRPLTVINLLCQAFEEQCSQGLEPECMDYVRESYLSTLRMNQLIDALLDFSRLSRTEPRRERIDLSAIAQAAAEELKLSDPERQVTLRITEGMAAHGDPELLKVVMDNLLGNAWKYTARVDGAEIEFGTCWSSGTPVFFVRDNGTGFDAADAEKLFTPFQRLPGAEVFEGFGIGLATVERIIRRHGGRVWAEGAPDKGATFYFTLPLSDSSGTSGGEGE